MPTPETTLALVCIPHDTNEFLRYVITQVIERPRDGTMWYDTERDHMVYHLTLTDTDREFFPLARGLDEVWVSTKARRES